VHPEWWRSQLRLIAAVIARGSGDIPMTLSLGVVTAGVQQLQWPVLKWKRRRQ
jgi:hypothetical protein